MTVTDHAGYRIGDHHVTELDHAGRLCLRYIGDGTPVAILTFPPPLVEAHHAPPLRRRKPTGYPEDARQRALARRDGATEGAEPAGADRAGQARARVDESPQRSQRDHLENSSTHAQPYPALSNRELVAPHSVGR